MVEDHIHTGSLWCSDFVFAGIHVDMPTRRILQTSVAIYYAGR